MPGAIAKILFVSCTPINDHPMMGVEQRLKILLEGLRMVGEVDFYKVDPSSRFPGRKTSTDGSLRDLASKLAILTPAIPRKNRKTSVALKFRNTRPEEYDVIFIHRLGTSWLAGWTDPKKTILDVDDITSRLYHERMQLGNPLFRIPRWFLYHWARWCEQKHLSSFRFNLVCSTDDKNYFHHKNVAVIPNTFWISEGSETPKYTKGTNDILFVGSLGWPPNSKGLTWFARQVFPLIREKLPDASLVIVGQMPKRNLSVLELNNIDGIELIGTVKEVSPYIKNTKIEICPLLNGQGTRIKIIESLAYAKPVVSTTIGAYGLPLKEEQGLFREDDPASFAEMCINLLQDEELSRRTGQAGQKYIFENLSPENIMQKVANLANEIIMEKN